MKKIFISHSSKNRKFIKKLKEQFPKRDYITWVSFEDIWPGKDFDEEIKRNLSKSDIVIFILTKQALKSAWVNQEIGFADAKLREIIPLIKNFKKLPGFLRGIYALKLDKRSPKNTFLAISPYLRDEDLFNEPPYLETKEEKTLSITITGHDMWINVLKNMEIDATPISSFMGSYSSYLKRDKEEKEKIDRRFAIFNDFFIETGIVEPVDLVDLKYRVYDYEDLENWSSHLEKPVLYKITELGKNSLQRWKKLGPGHTLTINIKKAP